MIGSALIVGVADYHQVSPDLPDAVRHDVSDVANLFCDPEIGELDPSRVTLLLDDRATVGAIRAAFSAAAGDLSSGETFLFYFSGHGTRGDEKGHEQSWLLPHDADLNHLAATALSSAELVACLNAIPASRQIVLIDACHAGGMGSTKAPGQAPKGFGKSGIEALSQGVGRVLLTSCRPDELSGILNGARNSIFTAALIDALLGAAIDRGDGVVRVLDIFAYVSIEVPKLHDQHPIFHAGDLDGNFPVARRKLALAAPNDTNSLTALFAKLYPAGPREERIWARAGGDVSRLDLSGSGFAQWHAALIKARAGGGGLTLKELYAEALQDFPGNAAISALFSQA